MATSILKVLVLYYCLCGILVFMLDFVASVRIGHFVMVSHSSVVAVRFLAPIGCVGSLLAVLHRGARGMARAGAAVFLIVFAVAAVLAWII